MFFARIQQEISFPALRPNKAVILSEAPSGSTVDGGLMRVAEGTPAMLVGR
jgi:hypothetical protein